MFETNNDYHYLYLEAQANMMVTDPYGNPFAIWSGMQFKWVGKTKTTSTCGSCGGKETESTTYVINAWAVCQEGEFLWPDGSSYKTITVDGKNFIETDNLKFPPVVNDFGSEIYGTDVDVFKHPKDRTVPRKGGLWYSDPWYTKRTE